MRKDKAAELRMAELAKAGVALSDKDTQTAKIRDMEDEEFGSYRDELVSLRRAVEAELAKAVLEEETQEEEAAEAEDEEVEEEVAAEEEELVEETLPANVDPGQAIAAALNMEVMPSDSVLAKYAKLGEAMAKRMNKDN